MNGPTLDPDLLSLLACPSCHGVLEAEPDLEHVRSLRCTSAACGLVYPVREGIPVLLVDEATDGRTAREASGDDD